MTLLKLLSPKVVRVCSVFTLFYILFSPMPALALVTPDNVYQASQQLELEIELIRQHRGVTTSARQPDVQSYKLPVHVYAKSREVQGKVQRLRQELGMERADLDSIPLRELTPADVLENVERIAEDLKAVKLHLGIAAAIVPPATPTGKSPSDVYEKLWRVSFLLDDLVKPINPDLVFRNVLQALREVESIAEELDIDLPAELPELRAGVTPLQPNIEGYRNLYRLARIERILGISPVRVANFPEGDITPADVYDTVNNILAELVRLKVEVEVEETEPVTIQSGNRKPGDVLAHMQLLGMYLDAVEQNL